MINLCLKNKSIPSGIKKLSSKIFSNKNLKEIKIDIHDENYSFTKNSIARNKAEVTICIISSGFKHNVKIRTQFYVNDDIFEEYSIINRRFGCIMEFIIRCNFDTNRFVFSSVKQTPKSIYTSSRNGKTKISHVSIINSEYINDLDTKSHKLFMLDEIIKSVNIKITKGLYD